MAAALAAAASAGVATSPNPMVGAVVAAGPDLVVTAYCDR